MKNIYSTYLSALRAFLHGTVPHELSGEAAAELWKLANANATGGIVGYAYMTHPDRVDADILQTMRSCCFSEIHLYARRAEQMKLLTAELSRNGIDCILFKGYVLREYYSVPELRSFSDIDFVIRREDRVKCDTMMKQLGFEPKDTWEPAYSYLKGSEFYEIHTDVMEVNVSDKADYTEYYSHIWDHVRPSPLAGQPHILEFTPEFHFLYLLTHIAKHVSGSGAGIRMYLDIAFFLKHFGAALDWQWVAQELKTLRFERFSNLVLSAVEQWFGVESPLPLNRVSPQTQEDFLEFTMEGGIYGRTGRDRSTVYLKQQNRNEEAVSKGKTLLYHAFPPARVMENRYTYLQKHPWLLPAAWVHRLAGSYSQWGRFADHTRNILTADEEAVRKLKRLYKEIGL